MLWESFHFFHTGVKAAFIAKPVVCIRVKGLNFSLNGRDSFFKANTRSWVQNRTSNHTFVKEWDSQIYSQGLVNLKFNGTKLKSHVLFFLHPTQLKITSLTGILSDGRFNHQLVIIPSHIITYHYGFIKGGPNPSMPP